MSEVERSGLTVWPKWCYQDTGLSTDTGDKFGVGRPLWGSSSSPGAASLSSSPLSSPSHQSSPPSSALTASPPLDLLSRSSLLSAPCSFSDLIRGLAAKYNDDVVKSYEPFTTECPQRSARQWKDRNVLPLKTGQAGTGSLSSDLRPSATPTRSSASSQPRAPPPLNMIDMLSWYRQNSFLTAAISESRSETADDIKPNMTRTHKSLKRSRSEADDLSVVGSSPLDLSQFTRSKISKKEVDVKTEEFPAAEQQSTNVKSFVGKHPQVCSSTGKPAMTADVENWSVEEVCAFVASIDQCAEYVTLFAEHRISGRALSLLRAEYLTNILGVKLGPALHFCAALSNRLGLCAVCSHCSHCHQAGGGRGGGGN